MNLMALAIPVFMATIALEVWVAHRRGLRLYDTADALTSLHLGIISQVAGIFLLGLLWVGIYVGAFQSWRLFTLPTNSPWVWLLALLGYDFCAYWAHRLDHKVNLLWAAHVVHHSSEYFNLSTALRQSGTTAFVHWIFYLPLALIGVPPMVFFSVSLVNLLYQYWVHTQLIGRMGWLDEVLVTPAIHRVHHGMNDYCIDRNFGGMLTVWDRMFGTFAPERADETIYYGARTPLHSYNPLWGTVHLYVDLWRQMRERSSLWGRLRLWFESPSGPTGVPPPFDASGFKRYDPAPPPVVARYALLQYVLLLPFVMHLLIAAHRLTWGERGLYAAGILVTMQCLGALLQGLPGARRFEAVRALAFGAAVALVPSWFDQALPLAVRVAIPLVVLGALLYGLRRPAPAASHALGEGLR